mgnify:CR=1 FL=1
MQQLPCACAWYASSCARRLRRRDAHGHEVRAQVQDLEVAALRGREDAVAEGGEGAEEAKPNDGEATKALSRNVVIKLMKEEEHT